MCNFIECVTHVPRYGKLFLVEHWARNMAVMKLPTIYRRYGNIILRRTLCIARSGHISLTTSNYLCFLGLEIDVAGLGPIT
jgi:hypothetical protein